MKSRARAPISFHLILLVLALPAWVAFGVPGQSSLEARKHADRGSRFAGLNDFKAAEAEFRQAVELSPNNPEYLTELGTILGLERKLEESTTYLEKALTLDPTNLATRQNLASNQWQTGHYEEARKNLKRVLAAKPGDPQTLLMLGIVTERLKEYREATRLLESVPALVKQQPESIAALARAYYHTGEKEKARQTLDELPGQSSGDAALFLGGKAAVDGEDYEEAERLFRSIHSDYPDPATLGYQLAFVQYRTGHLDQCQDTLNELLAGGHLSVDIYDLLALSYLRQGKETEANRTLNESVERITYKEADYLKLGTMLLENKRLAGALAAAKKAVELAPNSGKAYTLKGEAELDLLSYTDAMQSFSRALELDPFSIDAHLGLATAQWLAGKTAEAAATFEDGLKRFPRDSRHYTKYACMLRELGLQKEDRGMVSRAISLFQKASSLDPSQADPHYEFADLLSSEGKTQEAVKELQTAAMLDAGNSRIHYSLAAAYRRLGRTADASKEMQVYDKLKAQEGSQQ